MTVFISYAHEDREFVNELIGQLRQVAIPFWYDNHIRAGETWSQSIDDAIADCAVLLLVNSTHALESPYVQYEWAFAVGATKPVIPILIESWQLLRTKTHDRLKAIQYLDFSTIRNWHDLLVRLAEFIEEQAISETLRNAIHALNAADSIGRLDAIHTLENLNEPYAVEILADAVQNHTALDVRIYAALALSVKTDCEDSRAINGLNELLCTKLASLEDRHAAVQALSSYNTEQVVPGLLCALSDETKPDQNQVSDEKQIELWCDAIIALRPFKFDSVRVELEDIALDMFRPPQVRQRSVDMLRWVGNSHSIPTLKEVLEDRDRELRIFAANSLAFIGGPQVRPLLREKAKRARGQEKESLEHILRKIKE